MARTPLTVALVNDYDIVLMGIAHILEQYRVVIAELDTNQSVSDEVDVVCTTPSRSRNPIMTRSAC